MLDWRILAFSVPLLFVTYQSLAKLLPKGTSVFLVNAYASMVGVLIMLSLHFLTRPDKSLRLSTKGFALAFVIGLLISLGNLGIIKALSLGAPQSLFSLFFYITLIIYGIIFGILFWHEKLHIFQLFGIILAMVGVFIAYRFRK